jgi:glycosyltransferase involved in cell wall biosynthesis
VRILIWHGYLLSGTGSNEYTRALAATLSSQGHDVTVLCQDPHADRYDLGGASVVRPALPGPLPVFVLDRYEEAEPRLLPDLERSVLDEYVRANAGAIAAAGPADLLIANHVLMGAPVAAASGVPFVVKAHGSELEFAMRGNDELCRWAAESLRPARAVIAGSRHIERVVRDLVDPAPDPIVVIPPGVDTTEMQPEPRALALPRLLAECAADRPNPGRANQRLPDEGNAALLSEFFADRTRPAAMYVGKLSEEKGVPLLIDAAEQAGLRLVVVGFGPLREDLQRRAGPHLVFTGPLQHRHLCHLWPLVEVSVVPSVFPEAFGMVAAEAAACGCPPMVAYQSGLAEVADGLVARYPEQLRSLASFTSGDIDDLVRGLRGVTGLDASDWSLLSRSARNAAVDLWSWDSVARRIVQLGVEADGPTGSS